MPHALPPETHLYGEGFTMLSQTAGTLGKPTDLGRALDLFLPDTAYADEHVDYTSDSARRGRSGVPWRAIRSRGARRAGSASVMTGPRSSR